jgi:hypothetical protein
MTPEQDRQLRLVSEKACAALCELRDLMGYYASRPGEETEGIYAFGIALCAARKFLFQIFNEPKLEAICEEAGEKLLDISVAPKGAN